MKKLHPLQTLLILGAIYFLIAAYAHFFGQTIFPFYVSKLYTPYHDTLLALCDLIFITIFLTAAKNPHNNDMLNVILIGLLLSIVFNFGIIFKIDFVALGSPEKLFQTKVETALAAIYALSILKLKRLF